MSEVLKEELKDSHLGVSVLCPGIVKTQIYQSERNRPDNANIAPPQSKASMETDFDTTYSRQLQPEHIADLVIQGVEANRFYIISHPEWKPLVDYRLSAVCDAFLTHS